MPTWFKCEKCGNKYYTAASSDVGNFDDFCEECNGRLVEVYYDVSRFLKRNLMVDFNLKKQGPSKLYSGKVLSINDDEVNLIVYSKRPNTILKELSACNISFAREESPEGRYFFHSKILSYYQEQDPQVVVETPEFVERKDERRAVRYPLKTRVKYRLGDDIQELMKKADGEYRVGETIDISKSGLLLLDKNARYDELSPDKYIDLEIEYGDYRISTIGNIARINRRKEIDGSLALGVKFIEGDSDNLEIIEELKGNKFAL
ncbi:MAG: PilZ domain-containing protein [Bacillota bacterium]